MQTSFENQILKMQGHIANFAIQLTNDKDEAKDLTQETLLKVFENKDKFKENTNLKGWLFTIMRNVFINNYRRKIYSSAIMDTIKNNVHLNVSQELDLNSAEEIYSTNEILSLIETFPEYYKIPFLMFIRGYKYLEISEHLKIPLGTTKSRIFIMRQKLQKLLKENKN